MNANARTVAPATAYQLYLVHVCGCSLTRGPANVWELHANPDRLETVPGTRIAHIPYADQDAAEDFERAFNRANPVFLGPVAQNHDERMFHTDGLHFVPARGGFGVYPRG